MFVTTLLFQNTLKSAFPADCIMRLLGSKPSRADPDLCIKQTGCGHNHIVTHVDDLIVASKHPQECVSLIEQEHALRNIEDDPSCHLGSKLKRLPCGRLQMNMEEHSKEVIQRCETKQNATLKKENIPMPVKVKPELTSQNCWMFQNMKDFNTRLDFTTSC